MKNKEDCLIQTFEIEVNSILPQKEQAWINFFNKLIKCKKDLYYAYEVNYLRQIINTHPLLTDKSKLELLEKEGSIRGELPS